MKRKYRHELKALEKGGGGRPPLPYVCFSCHYRTYSNVVCVVQLAALTTFDRLEHAPGPVILEDDVYLEGDHAAGLHLQGLRIGLSDDV